MDRKPKPSLMPKTAEAGLASPMVITLSLRSQRPMVTPPVTGRISREATTHPGNIFREATRWPVQRVLSPCNQLDLRLAV
jgi:hypothetical protein